MNDTLLTPPSPLPDPKIAKITVVVPVFNAQDTIGACIDALKNQTDPNYDVVFVDDASTDQSASLCEASGYTTVILPHNKGQAVARNEGVNHANGDIIAFLDSDAVPPPKWLERHRALLVRNPSAHMVCGGYSKSLSATTPGQFAFLETAYRRKFLPQFIDSCTGSNCVVYKKPFNAVGGYPEYYLTRREGRPQDKAVSTAEDAELGYLLTRGGHPIIWTSENPVAHYFRSTWTGYWKQQLSYSRHLTISLFRYPDKWRQKGIYGGESVFPQIALAVLILMAPALALILPQFALVCWLLLLASTGTLVGMHFPLLRHLNRRMTGFQPWIIIPALVISRLYWLAGILLGALDGVRMVFWHHLVQR